MKRAMGARHTECMHHIGCNNEAVLENMVDFHVEKLHIYIYIGVLHQNEEGMGDPGIYDGYCHHL